MTYSATADPFMFQGGYHMPGGDAGAGNVPNGLYHFGERYYEPTTGRWTQPDPAGGLTEFAFAGDDPMNDFDPSGDSIVSFVEHGAEELYEDGKVTVEELKEVHEGHYTHALDLLEHAKPVYDCYKEAAAWQESFGNTPYWEINDSVAAAGCAAGAAPR
jgi:RHS repeat-associated protein